MKVIHTFNTWLKERINTGAKLWQIVAYMMMFDNIYDNTLSHVFASTMLLLLVYRTFLKEDTQIEH